MGKNKRIAVEERDFPNSPPPNEDDQGPLMGVKWPVCLVVGKVEDITRIPESELDDYNYLASTLNRPYWEKEHKYYAITVRIQTLQRVLILRREIFNLEALRGRYSLFLLYREGIELLTNLQKGIRQAYILSYTVSEEFRVTINSPHTALTEVPLTQVENSLFVSDFVLYCCFNGLVQRPQLGRSCIRMMDTSLEERSTDDNNEEDNEGGENFKCQESDSSEDEQ